MNLECKQLTLLFFILTALITIAFTSQQEISDDKILAYVVDPKKQKIDFYWKDDKGVIFNSIQNLKNYVENKKLNLVFATNGGMYQKNYSPQGLFIQNEKQITAIDTSSGEGNFYLKPNGIFYITKSNTAAVCKTEDLLKNETIKYATQSGPMLIVDGKIHSAFKKESVNLNIRNGVGILPNNKILFAMSKKEINFYEFAKYFQDQGCKTALYLDGFVSRTYLPEKKWLQTDGKFGVIIGVTSKAQK